MTTIKKILCAIDLTKASRNAFDRALGLARVSTARLYILHAVPASQRFSQHQSERLELLTSPRRVGHADRPLGRSVGEARPEHVEHIVRMIARDDIATTLFG